MLTKHITRTSACRGTQGASGRAPAQPLGGHLLQPQQSRIWSPAAALSMKGGAPVPRGGRNRKPLFQVVREGNPGKRPVRDAVVLPPSGLVEPDWSELLPGGDAEVAGVRKEAAALWSRTAPTLARSVGLVHEQQEALVDYCVTWSRIRQGERALSAQGMVVAGRAGGVVRNPWTTVLNQYRSHARALAAELGLTPRAAVGLVRAPTDHEEDPFD